MCLRCVRRTVQERVWRALCARCAWSGQASDQKAVDVRATCQHTKPMIPYNAAPRGSNQAQAVQKALPAGHAPAVQQPHSAAFLPLIISRLPAPLPSAAVHHNLLPLHTLHSTHLPELLLLQLQLLGAALLINVLHRGHLLLPVTIRKHHERHQVVRQIDLQKMPRGQVVRVASLQRSAGSRMCHVQRVQQAAGA